MGIISDNEGSICPGRVMFRLGENCVEPGCLMDDTADEFMSIAPISERMFQIREGIVTFWSRDGDKEMDESVTIVAIMHKIKFTYNSEENNE
ncbi:uncharacterized protein MONOS_18058 [Monocercomonoides exilis]|uniref:uncharacterized protein n=1 Tax=Monocercomonoides exilis TaxID=2049356 RepID=UPI0035599AE2|nr:hypothetical protein MONOS_18058 [Monocercomonoides exilis]